MSCTTHLANIGVCPITDLEVVIDLCNASAAISALNYYAIVLKDHVVSESIQNVELTLGSPVGS